MKVFHKVILLFIFSLCALNAKIADINEVNNAKKVIQIGMFEDQQNIDACVKKLENKYDLFFKSYQNLRIVYAVNIDKDNLMSSIKNIKNYYSDAFVNHKVYFKQTMQNVKMTPNVFSDNSRVNIIQVGMFEQRENINKSVQQFEEYNLMIKPYKNTHIVYVIDIKMNMIDKMLNKVPLIGRLE